MNEMDRVKARLAKEFRHPAAKALQVACVALVALVAARADVVREVRDITAGADLTALGAAEEAATEAHANAASALSAAVQADSTPDVIETKATMMALLYLDSEAIFFEVDCLLHHAAELEKGFDPEKTGEMPVASQRVLLAAEQANAAS